MPPSKWTFLAVLLIVPLLLQAQTTIFYQGFESTVPCNNWGYTGGVVNSETVRTGASSNRVGRSGESNSLVFNTVDVTGLAGLQLRFYHAVRGGSGPGMDTDEGAVVQVRINGGAWTTIDAVSGYGDYNWNWTSTSGGNPGNGCLYTMPNPMSYTFPAGTNTIALRIFSTRGSCPAGTALAYNRTDEGLFIDDVSLTTTTTPLPFIWTGATDTDWHKCSNWRYGVVPGATSDVTIDQTAVNDCEVYSANASCASLFLGSTNANTWELTIRSGRQLNVTNAVDVVRSGSGGAIGITLGTAGTGGISCGALSLTGSAAGNKTAFFRNEVGTNGMLIRGDVNIQTGGYLDLSGAAGGIMQIQGDLRNFDGEAAFEELSSLTWFSGGAAQAITTGGHEERFGSIRMGKSANDLTLNAPIGIRAALILNYSVTPGGRIFSSTTNLLSMEAAATVSGATDLSHVDGPVRKFGTANFTYPIGKGSIYRPAQLTAVAGASTDAFVAEYFPASARTTFGTMAEPTLHHVSDCEYWMIERSVGTPNARVALSWHNTVSCGVDVLPELRVAWWDTPGTIWRDRGNNGTTTTAWGGWVPSTAVQSQFGAWTLSSTTANNPLPIELLFFDAQAVDDRVRCTWTTLSERDNDHFLVERSGDGSTFHSIGRVGGAGYSWSQLNYELIDPWPLTGISYYRLRQVDLDGSATVSQTVAVHFTAVGQELLLLPVGTGYEVRHALSEDASYELLDAAGRLVQSGTSEGSRFIIPGDRLASGVHILLVHDRERRDHVRFVH
ncbi:MAG: hypothetical protein R2815_09975 [Flavobacteriales bacterium]